MAHARLVRHVLEGAIAAVVIKEAPADVRDVQIGESVVIEIAGGRGAAVT